MWYTEIESKIVEHGRRNEKKELAHYRALLLDKHRVANYMLSRFLDEYGEELDDNPNAMNLFKALSEDYTRLERLLTILNVYDK